MKADKDKSFDIAIKLINQMSEAISDEDNINYVGSINTEEQINDFLYALLVLVPNIAVNRFGVLGDQDALDTNHTANRLICINSQEDTEDED